MERLRQQQEESTNRIEVNYIRKQQQDEVKKQFGVDLHTEVRIIGEEQEVTNWVASFFIPYIRCNIRYVKFILYISKGPKLIYK